MGHEERNIRPGDIQGCVNANRMRYKNNTLESINWNFKNFDLHARMKQFCKYLQRHKFSALH
jgi:hypothetical protein